MRDIRATLARTALRHPVWLVGVSLVIGAAVGAAATDEEPAPTSIRATTVPATSPSVPEPSLEPAAPSSDDLAPAIEVPGVVGQKLIGASRSLERLGFEVVASQEVSREPAGTVLSQDPPAGSALEDGAIVHLLVAEAPPAIPDVVGLEVARARRELEAAGFDVIVKREASSQAAGTVLSQTPTFGVAAMPGRNITIVVAKASAPEEPGGGNCTAGYSPCLPPASDYDCIGGSGDGPEYTGRVTVTGSDPYGLDSDNDGIGCE